MDGDEGSDEVMLMEEEEESATNKESLVFMWGYLPGALPQRSPLLSPVVVRLPASVGVGDSWKDVCVGGCGFAMAITESGKLITWGSTDDMGQSYVTSGKHGETPEPFPLPTEASMVKAAAGWAHCISVTETGDVYTWGWKECVPTGKVIGDQPAGGSMEMDQQLEPHSSLMTEQASPRSQGSRSTSGAGFGRKGGGVEGTKRRRISSSKQTPESSTTGDEILSALPCLVTLSPGVRIVSVSAGGRHTLALSDMGQVWGWGYGGEGQLGLGSRIRMVSSPHPIPCMEPSAYSQGSSSAIPRGGMGSEEQVYKCGQGSTDDELSPTCVSSLLGIRIQGMAAGLWHTVCISAEGDVYAFGGNQFGQLGTGADTAETLPRLLEAPSLESEHAKFVSCGARHSAILTEGGKVFCWGWNKYGQLGLGDVIDRNIPSEVPFEGCLPKNVACGWWHTLVLAESPT